VGITGTLPYATSTGLEDAGAVCPPREIRLQKSREVEAVANVIEQAAAACE
jgi:hypothetical protein